jgi:hypothetical protein
MVGKIGKVEVEVVKVWKRLKEKIMRPGNGWRSSSMRWGIEKVEKGWLHVVHAGEETGDGFKYGWLMLVSTVVLYTYIRLLPPEWMKQNEV